MKLRNWLNNNSAVVTILAVVMLILSLGAIIIMNRGSSYTPRVYDVYFYDLNTKKLFVGKSNQYAPIATPDGGDRGVRAYVFSCGDCGDESQQFIGYLEMFKPEAKKFFENPESFTPEQLANQPDLYEEGRLVRAEAENAKWVNANSMDGMKLADLAYTRCNGQPAKPCNPDSK